MISGTSGIRDLINKLENREEQKRILIIDDDPGYISLLRGWLKDDYKVFMSTSGETALEWISGNNADLILLDYEMPDINGPQMLKKIKELKTAGAAGKNSSSGISLSEDTAVSSSETPVVYITGNDADVMEENIRADKSGLKPDGCIYKTTGRDEMLKLVSSYLKS